MAFSFSYRGVRSENLEIEVLDIRRSILPPNDIFTIDIPGRAGEFFARNEYDMRTFDVEILIKKQNSLEAIQEQTKKVGDFLDATKGLGELIFDDDPHRSYQAMILRDTDVEQTVRFRRGVITFLVPNPYSESLIEKEATIDGFQATFTRGSKAYKLDGEQVFPTYPRYEKGVFGQGITIEEGTTNLVSENLSNFESGTAGMVGKDAKVDRDVKHAFNGNFSLRVKTNGAGIIDEGVETPLLTGYSSSATYTSSVYAIANKGVILKIVLLEYTAGDVFIQATNSIPVYIYDETGEKVRMIHTFTTSATTAKIIMRVVTTTTQYVTFWLDGLQIEAKEYATSWMMGSFTRANETLLFPLRDYLRNDVSVREGTIEFAFKRINPLSGEWAALFDWGEWEIDYKKDRIVIYHGIGFADGLRRLTFEIVNGMDETHESVSIVLPTITQQLEFYYIAVRWSLPGIMKIDIYDYEYKILYSNTKSVTINPPNFTSYLNANLGVSGGTYWVNAVYDEFRAIKRMREDSEIVAATTRTRPLSVDADEVVKLTFNENFNLYNTDISNVGTASVTPVIVVVVSSPPTYIQVTHDNSGKFLRVEDPILAIGDVIRFEGPENMVYLNNLPAMYILTLESEFFDLVKDDNAITVISDGIVETKISYVPRWL